MFINRGFITFARCFSKETDGKGAAEVNCNSFLSAENFLNSVDHLSRNNVENRLSVGFTPEHTDGYAPYFNSNSQRQFHMLPSSHNLISGSSYYENFSSYDHNLMMGYNNAFYSNTSRQLHDFLSVLAALKHQNNVNFQQFTCANEIESRNIPNTAYNESSTLNVSNQAACCVSIENKRTHENDYEILTHKRRNDSECENKSYKARIVDSKCSGSQINTHASNIVNSSANQTTNNEISKHTAVDQNANQPFEPAEISLKKFKKILVWLNLVKTYEVRFSNLLNQNESFYSIMSVNFKELDNITEYVKQLSKRWIQKERFIEDTENKGIVFKSLYNLALDVKNTTVFFKRSIIQKGNAVYTAQIFSDRNISLKIRIEDHKKSIKKLKMLGIEKILNDISTENILNEDCTMRKFTFIYQEINNSYDIQNFEIHIKQKFYPISFSVFGDSVFLCIYSLNQYLKIYKVNLELKNSHEINKYVLNEEKSISRLNFGFGSIHTIIRSGSEGKLFILKSPLKKRNRSRANTRNIFEMIVVDRELKMLACIQIDTVKWMDSYFLPAILNFVVHNDLVYAFDIQSRCIKIFSDSLVLLKMVPIPEGLTYAVNIHLTVSTKYILISAEKTIYYIKNNEHCAEFKKIELDSFIFNVAFYDEEHILVRFSDHCSSLKIEDNMFYLKRIEFPYLDRLNGIVLINFMIKDNFVYFLCDQSYELCRLNLTFYTLDEAIQ